MQIRCDKAITRSVPGTVALTAGLSKLMAGRRAGVTVVTRVRNEYASTFPSEIVTCRLADGREKRLFCKYGRGPGHCDEGWRGGVFYESRVYRQILQELPLPIPRLFGFLSKKDRGGPALVLEYVEDSLRLSLAPDNRALCDAAAWAGRFHALHENRFEDRSADFPVQYTVDYFSQWSNRLLRRARSNRRWLPRLRGICRAYTKRIPLLVGRPATIIHGEFTPHNVLWRKGTAFPTDWETAVRAAGEIDLATLVEGWADNVRLSCEKRYRQARWPDRAPNSFMETLGTARLYVAIRWLAVSRQWSLGTGLTNRLATFCERAESLGMV